jgi:hypothetical protein
MVVVTKEHRRFAMRRIIRRLTLLAAALMVMAVPAFSDEGIADYKFWGAYEPDQQAPSAETLAGWRFEGMYEPDQQVLSDEGIAGYKYWGAYEPGQQGVKDECTLVASNCNEQSDTIR